MKNIFKKLGFTCLGVAACGTASSLITSTNAQQVVQTLAEAKVNEAIEANKPLIDNVKDQLKTLKAEIEKNVFDFNYETSTGIVCAQLVKPTLNKECVIEFVMPKGKTKVNELKVMCGNKDVTNQASLTYAPCRTVYVKIPKDVIDGDVKVTINSTSNNIVSLNNDDPQTISLINNPTITDGSDLVLEYKVEDGQLFSAEVVGKRIGDDKYCEIKADYKPSSKAGVWNVIIGADELSSITAIYVKTRNAIKVNSILDIYENASIETQLAQNNEDLEGWDWSKGQTSPYHRWIDEQYNKAVEQVKAGNLKSDRDTLWDIRNWAYDNGKEVKNAVDNETIRRNRVNFSFASKNESEYRFNCYVSPNADQKALGLVRNNSEGQKSAVAFDQFHELNNKVDETAGNVSYCDNEIIIHSGKHKEGRYVYVPFKVELSTPLDLNALYNLFPSMDIAYTVESNYRAFTGHTGNHFLTQLYYFGEGDKAKYSRPDWFDSEFADKDSSKWDKNVIWRNHFYRGGDHDVEKGHLGMGDALKNSTNCVTKDEPKTLYFGLYVAAKSRPNKYGSLGYTVSLNPSFSDKNCKLNVTEGKEFYQQSKRFERWCEDENAKQDFSLKNDLAKDGAINPNEIKHGKTDLTVKSTKWNENLRGIYLPVNNQVKLPAHTKAKVNIGMLSNVAFNRRKTVNVWDTRIQDYTSFFNTNPEVVKNYFEKNKVNDILIPADDKYADNDHADKIVNDVLIGCEKFTKKLKGADLFLTMVITFFAAVGFFLILFAPWTEIELAFIGTICLIVFGTLATFKYTKIAHAETRIDTLEFIKGSHDFFQSSGKESIYKDIEIVNDTDEDKIFTFDMAYANVLEGERHKEKPISCDYHITSLVRVTDIKKI